MVMVTSQMMDLGTKAPDFELPDFNGKTHSRADFEGNKGLLVVFMCNHCPYVIHIEDKLAEIAKEYQDKGVAVVGINSNDIGNYPADSPEKMKERAEKVGFTFPYLLDESQEVAKAYRASCTPDLFLFDADHTLVYRGQFDSTRPDQGRPATGEDIKAALEALVQSREIPQNQRPSAGCNIKWKSGNAPAYFG
ncbi:thioredoxin family protein [bacterium]|nr:thioredoxin family protein [bacterium]